MPDRFLHLRLLRFPPRINTEETLGLASVLRRLQAAARPAMKALGAAGGMQGLGAAGPQGLGADAGQRQGLGAAGLYGLGVDAGQHVLGTADSQHIPGDMANSVRCGIGIRW